MLYDKEMTWDELFILQATVIAHKSKDSSTKVGCVIVSDDNVILSTGFNGFPRGIEEKNEARWKRPEKYHWVEHAERNAIYNAARHGIKLAGARAYLNWEPKPCADCTRALIQAGIKEIIGPNRPFGGKGAGTHYSIDHADVMLKEAGVIQRTWPMTPEMLDSLF
jgi:dCMP deaminase